MTENSQLHWSKAFKAEEKHFGFQAQMPKLEKRI